MPTSRRRLQQFLQNAVRMLSRVHRCLCTSFSRARISRDQTFQSGERDLFGVRVSGVICAPRPTGVPGEDRAAWRLITSLFLPSFFSSLWSLLPFSFTYPSRIVLTYTTNSSIFSKEELWFNWLSTISRSTACRVL
jgi:hypothetical protein